VEREDSKSKVRQLKRNPEVAQDIKEKKIKRRKEMKIKTQASRTIKSL